MNEEFRHVPGEEKVLEQPQADSEAGDDIVTIDSERADAIVARTVNVRQSGVNSIKAETVHLKQGGAQNVQAETVHLQQGGIMFAAANRIELTQGGIMQARGETVTLHDGGAGAVFARRAELENTSVLLLAAREVSGEAKVLFDLKAAILFGLVTGLVVGLLKRFTGRKAA